MKIDGYFCGWIGVGITKENGQHFLSQEALKRNITLSKTWVEDECALATNSELCRREGYVSVIAGAPRWGDSELARVAVEQDNSAALIVGFIKYGAKVLRLLSGQFSLFVCDSKGNDGLIAIDRVGQQHLFYAVTDRGVIVSSRGDSVAQHPAIQAEIDPQGIYNYLYFHSVPSPGSIYKNVRKLENATYVQIKGGHVETRRYWEPQFNEDPTRNDTEEELQRQMLDIVSSSVKSCIGGKSVGAFLSGGLDSSTVSGMLSKNLSSGKAKTFSIGFDAEGYDEISYARMASKQFNTDAHEYYVTPEDVLGMVEKIAAYYDEPFGNSSALPAYFCAKLAKENGVERLLAGDGGDEIFAGNERYAKQTVFSHYNKIPSIFRKLILEPVFLSNVGSRLPLGDKVKSYISQANMGLPDRLEVYNFLHKHTAEQIFAESILSSIKRDEPLDMLRRVYRTPNDAQALNRMLFMDWKRTLHDNDLVKVNHMCQLAGIEVAYPLLSDELVEFSCSIPSYLKMKDNKLRSFFKDSVTGFLPSEIINKPKHGFGLPFGVWTKEDKRLQELAYDAVSSLKTRNIFNDEFIDMTIQKHQSVHASYYGELVWILMMLELWFRGKGIR